MSHTAQVESTPTTARTSPIRPANPGRPVIEVNGLRVTYPGSTTPAVDGVSFAVAAGEIFGFLGPNGAGKTTTLKLLMGLMYPTSGSARILGREINDPVMKAQIGFLPEQPYFYEYLTAHELLKY